MSLTIRTVNSDTHLKIIGLLYFSVTSISIPFDLKAIKLNYFIEVTIGEVIGMFRVIPRVSIA